MDLLAIVLGPVLLVVGIAAGSFIGYWYRKQVAAKTNIPARPNTLWYIPVLMRSDIGIIQPTIRLASELK